MATRFLPILYVRGFAMTQGEIDETTADPFCGFNLGSTVYRAVPDRKRPPRKYMFESPVIRLGSDYGYRDVYEDGYDLMDPEWQADPGNHLASASIIVYRYYDQASTLLGNGETPSIEEFAKGLSNLIAHVRELVCKNPANKVTKGEFRCILVAHSMGGLVCRTFLQNAKCDPKGVVECVDKLFTYATPHNGIDAAGMNVPKWLSFGDTNNFNRDRMAKYLAIPAAVYKKTERVDWLPEERFPTSRAFTMVGTNRSDYEAAMGLSRTFVGSGSDGLVRIENATLTGLTADGKPGAECAKAFCYRSHSGPFGIVNSEEAYQNLVRFLFGDLRVDVHVDIEGVTLPMALQSKERDVNALYQIELQASPRGKLWRLTRRVAEEDSVACFTHEEVRDAKKQTVKVTKYLSTVFLSQRAKVHRNRPTLAYRVDVGVRVPDYEVKRTLWFDEHYEGGYLFRDAMIVEVTPPATPQDFWKADFAWQGNSVAAAATAMPGVVRADGTAEFSVPFAGGSAPSVRGTLRFVVSPWNDNTDPFT